MAGYTYDGDGNRVGRFNRTAGTIFWYEAGSENLDESGPNGTIHFTEQGVAMLSSVLRSKRAVMVNIQITRVFVKLREMLATHRELARKLAQLEKRIEGHNEEITAIFEAIRQLMEPPDKSTRRIGFHG